MAADCVSLIDSLFSAEQKFVVVGHDRGAHVAYRMAKDWKNRVAGACVMDVIPIKHKFESEVFVSVSPLLVMRSTI